MKRSLLVGNTAYVPAVRALFGGGDASGQQNVIDYINISSTGNATDFGDLVQARWYIASCSSSTRGIFAGGRTTGNVDRNEIDYVTIASTGNATDFGDLSNSRFMPAGASSSTRGVFAGGWDSSNQSSIIDYITIATTGNATNFGNLSAVSAHKSWIFLTHKRCVWWWLCGFISKYY